MPDLNSAQLEDSGPGLGYPIIADVPEANHCAIDESTDHEKWTANRRADAIENMEEAFRRGALRFGGDAFGSPALLVKSAAGQASKGRRTTVGDIAEAFFAQGNASAVPLLQKTAAARFAKLLSGPTPVASTGAVLRALVPGAKYRFDWEVFRFLEVLPGERLLFSGGPIGEQPITLLLPDDKNDTLRLPDPEWLRVMIRRRRFGPFDPSAKPMSTDKYSLLPPAFPPPGIYAWSDARDYEPAVAAHAAP